MKKICLLIMLMLSFGCAQNRLNVPVEDFTENVKAIGVLPIAVDEASDIRHPQKTELIQLITDLNRKYESQLVRKIKETGNFGIVTLMDGDARQLFDNLLFRREKRNDATIEYNKYFWKGEELRSYLNRNRLDAVMIVVVSGLTRNDRISSLNPLSTISTDFNFLVLSAQIVDGNGTILWEYPNFRGRLLSYNPLINLQYPDFSEAEANMISKANLKFRSLDGIRRKLTEKRKDLLLRETQEPAAYGHQFDEIISSLKFSPDKEKKSSVTKTEKPVAAEPATTAAAQPATAAEPVKPTLPAAPVADTVTPEASPEAVKPGSNEIAPAAGKIY